MRPAEHFEDVVKLRLHSKESDLDFQTAVAQKPPHPPRAAHSPQPHHHSRPYCRGRRRNRPASRGIERLEHGGLKFLSKFPAGSRRSARCLGRRLAALRSLAYSGDNLAGLGVEFFEQRIDPLLVLFELGFLALLPFPLDFSFAARELLALALQILLGGPKLLDPPVQFAQQSCDFAILSGESLLGAFDDPGRNAQPPRDLESR